MTRHGLAFTPRVIVRGAIHRAALTWSLVAIVVLAGCAAPPASPSPSVAASAEPTSSPGLPSEPGATPGAPADVPPTAPAQEPSVPSRSYEAVPVTLEMQADCGLCGPDYWLYALPRFRLYADGLAIFRSTEGDAATAPYRFAEVPYAEVEALVRYALDEGGMRRALEHYRGTMDDAGAVRLSLDASFLDEAADIETLVEPIEEGATTDADGNPLTDLPRRAQLTALAALLSDFDAWLADRGIQSAPFEPYAYTAALAEMSEAEADDPWPWSDLDPATFGLDEFGWGLARITPGQARAAGVGPGGASLGMRAVGTGSATVLVRPLLPGDDRPGAFGLRADTVAVAIEPGLRVRSLPEVSDQSVLQSPLLDRGDAMYIVGGPEPGSGYDWYHVYVPRSGLSGWVAGGARTGEAWIAPVPLECTLGASPDAILDEIGYELMHLACFSGVQLSGRYMLAPRVAANPGCPGSMEGTHEPAWIDMPLACIHDFRSEAADTGAYDLPAGGVLHPSIADVPGDLLEASLNGLVVEATGQLDHPDARSCTAIGDVVPDEVIVELGCRMTFVITGIRPVD
jgi:hypothetical protein